MDPGIPSPEKNGVNQMLLSYTMGTCKVQAVRPPGLILLLVLQSSLGKLQVEKYSLGETAPSLCVGNKMRRYTTGARQHNE